MQMDYKAVAHMTRWALADTIFQLGFIPEDKLAWKPAEGVKSAAEIVGEIVMVFRMMQPVFAGEDMPAIAPEAPATLAEAKGVLQEAGAELDRTLDTPMGPLGGETSVLYPCIELIHHHGQITYLQSLIGDHDQHADMAVMQQYWGPKGA
jgi:hypothetical protein